MRDFFIENGILKAYDGKEKLVVVPDGVTKIGGECEADCPSYLTGDPIGYKAFFKNNTLEELYLPDSVVEIGFKSLEHCFSLKLLAFSSNMKTLGCNALVGCDSLKTIIYRGTIYEFTCLDFYGQTPDLNVVHCTDGKIQFGKNRKHYIDTLYFPGTREEWDEKYGPDDWRNKRCKQIVFADEYDYDYVHGIDINFE